MVSRLPQTALQPGYTDALLQTWKPLGFLNLFRLLIAGFFSILFFIDYHFPPLASHNNNLFFATSLIYFALAGVFAVLIKRQKPQFDVQVYLHIFSDILAVTLLMHASGGVVSGLGTLLIISIAGGSIVMGGRHALVFASIASLSVLVEELYVQSEGIIKTSSTLPAGVLGLTLFITAIVVHAFAKRIRETEALAQKRGIDLANMSQLTEHIIQRMQTGIMVIDPDYRVRLMNESAWYMLGMPATANNSILGIVFPALAEQVQAWRRNPEMPSQVITPSAEHANVMPRFARIGQGGDSGTLIFLEDTSAMAQQAQQLQLASLGRLTASIAHEIRNPLGAISHAGQLLAESHNIDDHDLRLTQIISDQSGRMNTIVENIMQLSRRDTSEPQLITLRSYLKNFMHDFLSVRDEESEVAYIDIDPMDIEVRFDPTHLQQILTNLCENGLRHSADYPGYPKVELHGGLSMEMSRPFLDIIDHGNGIDAETATHIFEPFFTTSASGTGLGLYISRELAECNQAHLNYLPQASGGSCFRLTFQDPRRQMH